MTDERALLDVFQKFCTFGSGSLNNLTSSKKSSPQMDGAKFVKFARDCHIIDPKVGVTTTDIDIIFNKVKEKGERKIDFDQFKKALPLLAQLRFPKLISLESTVALNNLILGSEGPALSGNVTLPENSKIVERMTDTSLFPSSHKLRFGSLGNLSSNETTNSQKNRINAATSTTKISNASRSTSSTNLSTTKATTANYSSNRPTSASLKKAGSGSGSGVFDRLTDSSKYTGTHKERFNKDGSGKGIQGRRSAEDNKGLHLRTFLK